MPDPPNWDLSTKMQKDLHIYVERKHRPMNIRKEENKFDLIFVDESPSPKMRPLKLGWPFKKVPHWEPPWISHCMYALLPPFRGQVLGRKSADSLQQQPQPQGRRLQSQVVLMVVCGNTPLQKPRMIWREWNQFVMNEEFQRQKFLQRIMFYVIHWF